MALTLVPITNFLLERVARDCSLPWRVPRVGLSLAPLLPRPGVGDYPLWALYKRDGISTPGPGSSGRGPSSSLHRVQGMANSHCFHSFDHMTHHAI